MPEDQFHWKYRVFHEPTDEEFDVANIGHPVPMGEMTYLAYEDPNGVQSYQELEEVEGHFFVLRPDSDHHARVAMAAYAFSCRQEFPHLANDLMTILTDIDYEEITGDLPDNVKKLR